MVVKKSVLELWRVIKETLSPPELKKLISLLKDFKHHRIVKTQLTASSRLLFKDDNKFLHRWFRDVLDDIKPQVEEQEDEVRGTQNEQEGDPKTEACVRNKESTSRTQGSKRKLETAMEYDEIQDLLTTRAEVEEKSKEDDVYHCDPKIGRNVGIEVPREGELEKDVTNGFQTMNFEGKKRRIWQQEPVVRSPKKTRTSMRLQPVTPSYKLILDEEQCPVSDPVLNNECSLKKFGDDLGNRTLTNYEVEMARCEEDMYEANMLMETLNSALEKADKVIRKEMKVKHLGVKFFRCIEWLYDRDMEKIVKDHHDQMFPVISRRLKQEMDKITVARGQWEPVWKKVFEENSAKQRESTAQDHMKK